PSLPSMSLKASPSTLLPPKTLITGWIRLSTKAVIRAVKAPPMTTPTARSMTLPCMTKFLKPFMGSSFVGGGTRDREPRCGPRGTLTDHRHHDSPHPEIVRHFSRPAALDRHGGLGRARRGAAQRRGAGPGGDDLEHARPDPRVREVRGIGRKQLDRRARPKMRHERL